VGDPSSSEEETIEDPLEGIETWHISQLIGKCIIHLEDQRYFLFLFLVISRNTSFKDMFIILGSVWFESEVG
jgi:hypothetical protein